MTQNKRSKSKVRPYLTSEEVMELAGVSRRLLTTVTEHGICEPYREPDTGILGWTLGQAELILQIRKMRAAGIGLDEIIRLKDEGTGAFKKAVNNAHMKLSRAERRDMKRALMRESAITETERMGTQKGYYLRYLPQRWMAIIPLGEDTDSQHDVYVQVSMMLADIVAHVGWASAGISGTLLGAPKLDEAARFAFIELAAQPQPIPMPGASADCGCYHDYGGACALDKQDPDCDACARFGSEVIKADHLRWKSYFAANPHDETGILFHDLQRPFPAGPWSGLTRLWLDHKELKAPDALDPAVARAEGMAAVRPRMMPQIVRLPLGVTACVLPAGTYLCHQYEIEEEDRALMELIGMVRVIPHRDMTVDEERNRSQEITCHLNEHPDRRGTGEFDERTDAITGLNRIGDPAQMGWMRLLEDSDLSKLVIPTATALTPESDYTVVCSNMPSADYNYLHRLELQILVDADGISDENDGKEFATVGIASSVIGVKRSGDVNATIRCRTCGSRIGVASGERVIVCSHCGRAQSVPKLEDDRRISALRQADDEMCAENFETAARIYRRASSSDPDDADLHWMLMLCRYGVRYREEPETGRRIPTVNRPQETPIAQDRDCQAALDLADDAQWAVYSSQIGSIETARREKFDQVDEVRSMSVFVAPTTGAFDGGTDRDNDERFLSDSEEPGMIENTRACGGDAADDESMDADTSHGKGSGFIHGIIGRFKQ